MTAAATLAAGPTFDPARSLGWRWGPLDGLNCSQRCVEAELRARGYPPSQVVRSLAAPLDLLRRWSSEWRFAGCHVSWEPVPAGAGAWERLQSVIAEGEHPIAVVDRFHWAGDEYEGRLHVQSYVVLALEVDGGCLVSLGIHADPGRGYQHRTPCDSRLLAALCRVGRVVVGPPPPAGDPGSFERTLVESSLGALAADLAVLRLFSARWEARPLRPAVAWPLGTHVFADLEPQLFLLGAALAGADGGASSDVRLAAETAAAAAWRLGTLLGLGHRDRRPEAYEAARQPMERLLAALDGLLAASERMTGRQGSVGRSPTLEPLVTRLAGLLASCYPKAAPSGAGGLERELRSWAGPPGRAVG